MIAGLLGVDAFSVWSVVQSAREGRMPVFLDSLELHYSVYVFVACLVLPLSFVGIAWLLSPFYMPRLTMKAQFRDLHREIQDWYDGRHQLPGRTFPHGTATEPSPRLLILVEKLRALGVHAPPLQPFDPSQWHDWFYRLAVWTATNNLRAAREYRRRASVGRWLRLRVFLRHPFSAERRAERQLAAGWDDDNPPADQILGLR